MLEADLNVTINTDDPSISQIVLSNEYRLVCEEFGLPLATMRDLTIAAAKAAFLAEEEKDELLLTLESEFQERLPGI
jgi:adenosine deaminase